MTIPIIRIPSAEYHREAPRRSRRRRRDRKQERALSLEPPAGGLLFASSVALAKEDANPPNSIAKRHGVAIGEDGHRKTTGEIVSVETPALALGRVAHCLILEGKAAFDEQFIVSDGPVNARTKEPFGKATKAYAEWLANQDREVVSARDYGFITKLQKSVWLHDAWEKLRPCPEDWQKTENVDG